jgi:hypothetical protein
LRLPDDHLVAIKREHEREMTTAKRDTEIRTRVDVKTEAIHGEAGNMIYSAGAPFEFHSMVLSSDEGEAEGAKKEALGDQTIEGVRAQGTRVTRTIPVGRIGNERAIEIVSETWYSPDLQMVVLSKRSDPRVGETIYKLTNVALAEPDASLFQVPAGVTVEQEKDHTFRMIDMQPRTRTRTPEEQPQQPEQPEPRN